MSLIPWRNKQNGNDAERAEQAPAIRKLRSEVDRMFDRLFHDPSDTLASWSEGTQWGPMLDLSETDTHLVIRAEVPGVDPKQVDITIVGAVLTISGEKSETTERKGESFYHTERRFGSFRRSVQLPRYVDTRKVSAEHANGVLTIQLAKSASATPKRVPVQAA